MSLELTSLYVIPFVTFTYYFYFIFSFELALSFHSLACLRGGVTDMDTLTDTSATPYLVSLFTSIDTQTFTLLPLPQYHYLAIPQWKEIQCTW